MFQGKSDALWRMQERYQGGDGILLLTHIRAASYNFLQLDDHK